MGWFGVNRDDKFAEYFSRLFLPPELALFSLYFFAVLEVMVGLIFLAKVFHPRLSSRLVRLGFKLSMLIFFCFSTGDILFGDRAELWEHGTFMILTLMTYQIYLGRFLEHGEVVGHENFARADMNKDSRISTEEFDAFMERLRQSCGIRHEPTSAGQQEILSKRG